jgi:hypothetical protein
MTICRDNVPDNLVTPARQASNNRANECVHIVRIRSDLKWCANPVRSTERDLTQLGDDLFAEDEPDGLGRLCEMTIRRRGGAEKGGVQQHARRGARDSRAASEKDDDGNSSEYTVPVKR